MKRTVLYIQFMRPCPEYSKIVLAIDPPSIRRRRATGEKEMGLYLELNDTFPIKTALGMLDTALKQHAHLIEPVDSKLYRFAEPSEFQEKYGRLWDERFPDDDEDDEETTS